MFCFSRGQPFVETIRMITKDFWRWSDEKRPQEKIWFEPVDSDSQCRKLSISETLQIFQLVRSAAKENWQLTVRDLDHQKIPRTVQKTIQQLFFISRLLILHVRAILFSLSVFSEIIYG